MASVLDNESTGTTDTTKNEWSMLWMMAQQNKDAPTQSIRNNFCIPFWPWQKLAYVLDNESTGATHTTKWIVKIMDDDQKQRRSNTKHLEQLMYFILAMKMGLCTRT